tara:strand:+ start:1719 stop:2582 length:864 start_codon:yes stop_codon:yes gene_type:complete
MPSKSKAQQRFMGLVHAYNKGDVPASKVSKQVKDVAKSMKKKDTKDFAKTKHKGLPNKVKQEINLETLIKENPAAVAAAVQAMQQMKAANPQTGRVNKMTTALSNKKHPAHKKAKSVFSKIVDKFKKKKKQEPKKQSKSDVDFYKKQFTGEVRKLVQQEIINELSPRVKRMSDKEMLQYVLYVKKYKPSLFRIMKKDRDVQKLVKKFKVESINEGKGVEKIMKMAKNKSFGKLAGRTVDGMTAQLFKQVYDKAPQNAKDKINKMNEKQLYVFMGKLWSKFGRQVSLR